MIRVTIERRLKEGKMGDLIPILRELRASAIHKPGFIGGETLVDTEDSSKVIVTCNWHSLDQWREWNTSEPRTKLYQKVAPLLSQEPKVTVYQVMSKE